MPSLWQQQQQRPAKKYDLALHIKNKDDIAKMPQSIDEISAKLRQDDLLSELLVCGELNKSIVHLRAREATRLSEIELAIPRIARLFGVSVEQVQPRYLFLLRDLEEHTAVQVNPQQVGLLNAVRVKRFFKTPSPPEWYLEVSSLEDAVMLAQRRSIFLGLNTPPIVIIPVRGPRKFVQCFKCSASGHYQSNCTSEVQVCGKCGAQHETRHCTIKEPENFQCPNCSPEDGRGHASYFRCCKNPKTRAEFKRRDASTKAPPDWLLNWQQARLLSAAGHMDHVPTAPAKRANSTGANPPTKKRRNLETKSGKSGPLTRSRGAERSNSSQDLVTPPSSQDRDCIHVATSFSSQEQSTADSEETLVEV